MPKPSTSANPPAPPAENITLALRLPASLHALLRLAAARHRRSLTQEIVVALESYAAQLGGEVT